MTEPERRFQRGVGPEPRTFAVPHDLDAPRVIFECAHCGLHLPASALIRPVRTGTAIYCPACHGRQP